MHYMNMALAAHIDCICLSSNFVPSNNSRAGKSVAFSVHLYKVFWVSLQLVGYYNPVQRTVLSRHFLGTIMASNEIYAPPYLMMLINMIFDCDQILKLYNRFVYISNEN